MMFTVRLSYECEELMPDLDDPRKQAMIRVQYHACSQSKTIIYCRQ